MNKIVNGQSVELTADEESAIIADWAANEPTQTELNERHNAPIIEQMNRADAAIIRAIVEGDTVRIEAHAASQSILRSQLK